MPHIHSGPGQYDHTVSAFIIKLDKEPRIILHRHKYVGKYLHFGGHIELDENPWQSLVREIKEESGYSLAQLKLLQPKNSLKKLGDLRIHPQAFLHVTYHYEELGHYHSDLKYVFVTNEQPENKPQKGESEDIKSFTQKEILELAEEEITDHDKKICLYVFDTLLREWEPTDPSAYQL